MNSPAGINTNSIPAWPVRVRGIVVPTPPVVTVEFFGPAAGAGGLGRMVLVDVVPEVFFFATDFLLDPVLVDSPPPP